MGSGDGSGEGSGEMQQQGAPPQYPGGQPMQYGSPPQGQQYPMQPAQPAGQTTIIVQQAPPRPANYLWLACLTFWCCNALFGCIAFILSLVSNSAADDGNYDNARNLGKASMWVSIAGVIVTLIIIVVVIILWFTVLNQVANCMMDSDGSKICY